MKKSNVLIALAITTALAVPFSVFAASSDTIAKSIKGFFGIDTSKLTDQQKADVNSYTTQMADLQKNFIDKMVENGTITKVQGDAEKSRIDAAVKSGDIGSFLNGMGRGSGRAEGMKGLNIDTSKLTDQQKSDLKATAKKVIDLEKSNVTKAIANGLITRDQGTNITNKLDTEAANLDSSDTSKDLEAYMGDFSGFMFFGKGKNGNTTLTDQQKTDLTTFVKDLATIKKELVDELVSDGVLTSVQGESQKSSIDEMTQARIDSGFTNGMMGRGGMKGFKGHEMRSGFNQNNGNNSTGAPSSTAPAL